MRLSATSKIFSISLTHCCLELGWHFPDNLKIGGDTHRVLKSRQILNLRVAREKSYIFNENTQPILLKRYFVETVFFSSSRLVPRNKSVNREGTISFLFDWM